NRGKVRCPVGIRVPGTMPDFPHTAPLLAHCRSERKPGLRQQRAPLHRKVIPRCPHLPPVLAPGNFALHSSDHAPTRSSPAHHSSAKPSPCHPQRAARLVHVLLALVTTAMPFVGCHRPALSPLTTLL